MRVDASSIGYVSNFKFVNRIVVFVAVVFKIFCQIRIFCAELFKFSFSHRLVMSVLAEGGQHELFGLLPFVYLYWLRFGLVFCFGVLFLVVSQRRGSVLLEQF